MATYPCISEKSTRVELDIVILRQDNASPCHSETKMLNENLKDCLLETMNTKERKSKTRFNLVSSYAAM